MVKIRLQGTKREIRWFLKFLEKDDRFKLMNTSDYYTNKGTEKYKRVYTSAYRNDEKISEMKEEKKPKSSYYGTGRRAN